VQKDVMVLMRRYAVRAVGALVAPAAFAGCYSYSVIDVAGAKPGMDVRARVSMATASQIGPSLGVSDARLISGAVVDNQRDGLTLRVPTVPAGTVGVQDALFQQILINRTDLLELESKQLDRTKTRWVVGAAVVGAAVVAATIIRSGRSTGDNAVVDPPSNFNRRGIHLRISPSVLLRR
jgi:hypothetical protein